jgi:serine/threonine protein phosphatase 1
MKTFIIGDIHGCFDELIALTQKIGLTDSDILISVGDIVDRGNQSKEVFAYFYNRPNSIVLMGNHERKHQNKILSYSQEIVKVQFGNDYERFLNWIDTLTYYYETEEAIIIHAFFEHDIPIALQKKEVLCGTTSGSRYLEKKYGKETFWNGYYTGSKPIIYGHHVVGDTPKISNNTYGIDTGACHGNYLTAIELPGFIIHQVKAKKDYWKEQQTIWQIPVLKAKNWNEMLFSDIEKQLAKLAYIQDPEIVNYLSTIYIWKEELQNSYSPIKDQIDIFTTDFIALHQENFNAEASKLKSKTYVFKSKTNSLTIDILKKSLNSPQKIIDLKNELNIH